MKGEKITVLQEKGQRTHFALGGQGRLWGLREGKKEGRRRDQGAPKLRRTSGPKERDMLEEQEEVMGEAWQEVECAL